LPYRPGKKIGGRFPSPPLPVCQTCQWLVVVVFPATLIVTIVLVLVIIVLG
jgi:hypothetical protein